DLDSTNTTETVNTFQDLTLILPPKKNNRPLPQKHSTDATIETINTSQGRGSVQTELVSTDDCTCDSQFPNKIE
ncbi:2882_t:CDS:2, partial [Funneliformis caledonium]